MTFPGFTGLTSLSDVRAAATLRGGDTNAKLVREKGEQLAEKRVEMEALSRKNGQGLSTGTTCWHFNPLVPETTVI